MDKNQEEQEKKEEPVNIRHTITAEETFTLAKDVYDIRCFIKNVYSNRAVISRRLNILTLTVSTVFMLLYSAYVLFSGLTKKLDFTSDILLYACLAAYAVLFVLLLVFSILSSRSSTKNVKKFKTVQKVFKISVRLISIGISITAIVLSGLESSNVAIDILIIVFSVITIIFQLLPLLFGGTGKLVRWLLSPVKVKVRFSKVVLEWYELAVSGSAQNGAVKKVSKKYFDDIGAAIDNYLIPVLGKKYITAITSSMLLSATDKAEEKDKPVIEGVLKNVFDYATECGYVTFNPCKDLNFEGSVEEEEKPKKTFKDRVVGLGKKIGMSMLDKYITGSSDKTDNTDK